MNDLELDDADAALAARVRATLQAVAAATPVDRDGLAPYVRPAAPARRRPLLAVAAAAALLTGAGTIAVARHQAGTVAGAPAPATATTATAATGETGAVHLLLGQVPDGLRMTAATDLGQAGTAAGSVGKPVRRLIYRSVAARVGTATIAVMSLPAGGVGDAGTRTVTTVGEELTAQFPVGRVQVSVSARGIAADALAEFVATFATAADGGSLMPPAAPPGFELVPGDTSALGIPTGTWVRYDDASATRAVSVTIDAGVIDEWALNPEFTTVEPTTVRGHAAIAFSGTSVKAMQQKTGSDTVPAKLPEIASLVWQEAPDSVVQLSANGFTLAELRTMAEGMVSADAGTWQRALAAHPTTVGKADPATAKPTVDTKGEQG